METTTAYFKDTADTDQHRVLIFAQNTENEELKKQLDIFEKAAEEVKKNKIDINIICSNRQSREAYVRYNVPFNSFAVLVVGKNNKVNLRSRKAVPFSELCDSLLIN